MLEEAPRLWPYVVGGLLALLVFALLIRRLRTPSRAQVMEQKLRRDAVDPMCAWAQAAFMIVSRDCDYAYLGEAEARKMLRDWWDVHGPRELHAALGTLSKSGRADNAWDLVRYMLVARMGVGAGYITNDDAWDEIRPVAMRLQRAYKTWNELGQSYVMARRQWRRFPLDGSEDDAEMKRIVENIAELRHGLWTRVEYGSDLARSEGL
jgi:hypothetical protein